MNIFESVLNCFEWLSATLDLASVSFVGHRDFEQTFHKVVQRRVWGVVGYLIIALSEIYW